ncbi:hypothetical protein EP837_02642 [Sphingobium sp. EP60837]|nr:hypothetical protein EP837_02642 [Sphingobium sp. EP60837]
MLAGGILLGWFSGSLALGLFLGAVASGLKHKAGASNMASPAVCLLSAGSRDAEQVVDDLHSLSHGA